jgi:uncharacterized protein (DUF885 family)
MRNWNVLLVIALGALMTACSPSETGDGSDPTAAFRDLLDEHWDTAIAEKVFFRMDPDAWRMDGKLSEHTPEARARRQQFNEAILGRLAGISVDDLGSDDQLSYRIFKYERETERESYRQPDHFFPITSMFGYHTYFAEAPSNMSFLSTSDYDDYLVSLADFTRYNREFIDVLRGAIEVGYTHYCGSIAGYAASLSGQHRRRSARALHEQRNRADQRGDSAWLRRAAGFFC